MAISQVTAINLRDAGIAAHLAASPTKLPSPSVYFQDFNFGATMWDAAYGNVDGGSVSGVGEAVADIAINNVLKLEEEQRKKDDPASDASMITELAERQREAMQAVFYSNGQFHMFGMDIDEEDTDAAVNDTLENIDDIAARHGIDAQQKAELATMLIAYQNADTPEEKAEILSEIADKQPEIAREMADDANSKREARNQNDLTNDETQNLQAEQIEAPVDYQTVQEQAALSEGYSANAAETNARETVQIREGVSSSGNPFESDYSPSVEFNAQAVGVQLADATRALPAPSINALALS